MSAVLMVPATSRLYAYCLTIGHVNSKSSDATEMGEGSLWHCAYDMTRARLHRDVTRPLPQIPLSRKSMC